MFKYFVIKFSEPTLDQKAVRSLSLLLAWLIALFLFVEFFGGYVLGLMANTACFAYVGCNAGFFGYDAIVHVIGGMTIGVAIIVLLRISTPYSSFSKSLPKLMGYALYVALFWEVLEFFADYIRTYVPHLYIFRFNPLFQTTMGDTFGDLLFSMLGTCAIGIPLLLAWARGKAPVRTLATQ